METFFNLYNYILGTLWQHILQRDGVASKNSNIWQKVDIYNVGPNKNGF